MKTTTQTILLSLLLLPALSLTRGATVPTMQVTVTNAGGKVVYQGTTSANGAFATGKLEPGNYVVQFISKKAAAKDSKLSLTLTDGKNNVGADAVAGDRFADPGVAMKLTVEAKVAVTGQVAPAGSHPAQTQSVASASTKAKTSAPVKIINGKRYVWVVPNTGSVSGGHWVEESVAAQGENTRLLQRNPPSQSSNGMRGY